jgi:hypothetical protein
VGVAGGRGAALVLCSSLSRNTIVLTSPFSRSANNTWLLGSSLQLKDDTNDDLKLKLEPESPNPGE